MFGNVVIPPAMLDANQIIALVIPWGLVSKNVPPHEIAHDKVFCSCGYDGESEELGFWHVALQELIHAV